MLSTAEGVSDEAPFVENRAPSRIFDIWAMGFSWAFRPVEINARAKAAKTVFLMLFMIVVLFIGYVSAKVQKNLYLYGL